MLDLRNFKFTKQQIFGLFISLQFGHTFTGEGIAGVKRELALFVLRSPGVDTFSKDFYKKLSWGGGGGNLKKGLLDIQRI